MVSLPLLVLSEKSQTSHHQSVVLIWKKTYRSPAIIIIIISTSAIQAFPSPLCSRLTGGGVSSCSTCLFLHECDTTAFVSECLADAEETSANTFLQLPTSLLSCVSVIFVCAPLPVQLLSPAAQQSSNAPSSVTDMTTLPLMWYCEIPGVLVLHKNYKFAFWHVCLWVLVHVEWLFKQQNNVHSLQYRAVIDCFGHGCTAVPSAAGHQLWRH